jgi:hypothetical protein
MAVVFTFNILKFQKQSMLRREMQLRAVNRLR